MSTSHSQSYEVHPVSRNIYWLTCTVVLVCGVTALAVSVNVVEGRWVISALGILFVACGVAMFIRPRTVVESDARIIRRELWLFGRFLISSRQYSFADFAAVVVRRVRRSNVDEGPDQFFVSLRRLSGQQILVRYFDADTAHLCRPAEELAQRLSADLQIEIADHNDQPERPAR